MKLKYKRIVVKKGIKGKWHSPYILECNNCHKHFSISPGQFKYGAGAFCSYACISPKVNKGRIAWNKGLKGFMAGSKNPTWQGGYFISEGYKHILKKEHPLTTKMGYVLEHRLVMEKHLGRYLNRKEVIHHLNGNTLDNRLKNLKLFSCQADHVKFHTTLKSS